MRNFGLVLLLAGGVGFFYCSSRASQLGPVPEHLSVEDSLRTDAGKNEAARYASAAAGFVGLLVVFASRIN